MSAHRQSAQALAHERTPAGSCSVCETWCAASSARGDAGTGSAVAWAWVAADAAQKASTTGSTCVAPQRLELVARRIGETRLAAGERVPRGSWIVAIADAFDAMDRPSSRRSWAGTYGSLSWRRRWSRFEYFAVVCGRMS
jgi:hypothetical protein